jgi:NlpC/P60 family putative phage cell wall peptidase
MISRQAILAEARDWIGTPYQHQASVKAAGCDCLGLVRGVWRAIYGAEPEAAPAYTPDWAERHGAETLLLAARRHLVETTLAAVLPGDVLLFRMDAQAPMKHCASLDCSPASGGAVTRSVTKGAVCRSPSVASGTRDTSPVNGRGDFIVHAYWGRAVVRSRFAPWWRARCAAAFSFPDAGPWPS